MLGPEGSWFCAKVFVVGLCIIRTKHLLLAAWECPAALNAPSLLALENPHFCLCPVQHVGEGFWSRLAYHKLVFEGQLRGQDAPRWQRAEAAIARSHLTCAWWAILSPPPPVPPSPLCLAVKGQVPHLLQVPPGPSPFPPCTRSFSRAVSLESQPAVCVKCHCAGARLRSPPAA